MFPHIVDFIDENFIGFIIEHVLILPYFDLSLSMCDIFVNKINDVRKNKIKLFIFIRRDI